MYVKLMALKPGHLSATTVLTMLDKRIFVFYGGGGMFPQTVPIFVFGNDILLSNFAQGPRQKGCHFADYIVKYIFLNENVRISTQISLTFVPLGSINN